jgi:hypothetical protein
LKAGGRLLLPPKVEWSARGGGACPDPLERWMARSWGRGEGEGGPPRRLFGQLGGGSHPPRRRPTKLRDREVDGWDDDEATLTHEEIMVARW